MIGVAVRHAPEDIQVRIRTFLPEPDVEVVSGLIVSLLPGGLVEGVV